MDTATGRSSTVTENHPLFAYRGDLVTAFCCVVPPPC